MPRTKLSDELKQAVLALSPREKDKLLLRLLPKDANLVQQLEFKLLEDGDTTELRREDVRREIDQALEQITTHFYSPGYLLLDLRALSGLINQHVKITKDKIGEIDLNFYMLNRALALAGRHLHRFPAHKSRTLNEYVVKRALKLQKLLGNIHEDYLLEFRDAMHELAGHIRKQKEMADVAKALKLDLEKLSRGETE